MSGVLALAGRVAAVLLPLVVGFALWAWIGRRRRVADLLGDPVLVARMAGGSLARVPRGRAAAVLLASLALAFALLDPRWGGAADGRETRGGPVILVLDASTSMRVADVAPDRLQVLRSTARRLLDALGDAPVGVVVFAGRAYALVPPTLDRGAVSLYLDALDPGMVTQTGSSLAAAVRQGVGLLAAGDTRAEEGTLVLISDGDAPEDAAGFREALDLARRAGVRVHAIGVGTADGASVPELDFGTGRVLGTKRDPAGAIVVSRLDAERLDEIASATGGLYANATDARAIEEVLAALVSRGGRAARGEGGGTPRFAWFAIPALLLLVGESLGAAAVRRGVG